VKTPYTKFYYFDKISITPRSHKILQELLDEHPDIHQLLMRADTDHDAVQAVQTWISGFINKRPLLKAYLLDKTQDHIPFHRLSWQDYGILRCWDYIEHAGRLFKDPNLNDEYVISHPIRQLWLAVKEGIGGAEPGFFIDMQMMFRQIKATDRYSLPDEKQLIDWMNKHPSGLDEEVIAMRQKNKERILRIFIKKMGQGLLSSKRYQFPDGADEREKYRLAEAWWDERNFHLRFAVRKPDLLNEYLDHSLSRETMELLHKAYKRGIPFFVNLYYLSLLHVGSNTRLAGTDLAIRDYVFYSRELIEEFGKIRAWEKEDRVEPGKPNAAGWILPEGNNIHRRYPEVAILIPDTIGRACGGLCVSCQRMYDFQNGRLNFNLDKLKPKESWTDKLKRLLDYFEEDEFLEDILITGGDALMSRDRSLKNILNAVLEMAQRKRENNRKTPSDKQKAEIKRVRLGTRLPVYLPQRITPGLCEILYDFRQKAMQAGITQFVIQTHFETAMEITPEARQGIERLLATGWIVSNQQVFTAAASRRGHTNKLRQTLNDLGVLTYYTFSVKGFHENYHNFATNARAVQESIEEKRLGVPDQEAMKELGDIVQQAPNLSEELTAFRQKHHLPFAATDRNVLNMPGVGKSLTFRTIGLTRFGRRILEFEHDRSRKHSPAINKMGKITIIESKSVMEYLDQIEAMGEESSEYLSIFGYSCNETEILPEIWELTK
jgi:lysine 2,3-aminomutase